MSGDYILTVFITLITVIDPIGLIPVYLPIASRYSRDKQIKIVWSAFFWALLVSTCFLFVGKILFRFLEIELDSLYIVGGILLFLIGLDMLYAKPRRTKSSPEEREEAMNLTDVSVFPIAIPMLSGPGTIATLIMFSSRYNSLDNYLVVFGALTISLLICAFTMIFSNKLLKFFRQTGLNVMNRVMGIILCSLAVQFIINSIRSIFLN